VKRGNEGKPPHPLTLPTWRGAVRRGLKRRRVLPPPEGQAEIVVSPEKGSILSPLLKGNGSIIGEKRSLQECQFRRTKKGHGLSRFSSLARTKKKKKKVPPIGSYLRVSDSC